jgi:hypothetical protein
MLAVSYHSVCVHATAKEAVVLDCMQVSSCNVCCMSCMVLLVCCHSVHALAAAQFGCCFGCDCSATKLTSTGASMWGVALLLMLREWLVWPSLHPGLSDCAEPCSSTCCCHSTVCRVSACFRARMLLLLQPCLLCRWETRTLLALIKKPAVVRRMAAPRLFINLMAWTGLCCFCCSVPNACLLGLGLTCHVADRCNEWARVSCHRSCARHMLVMVGRCLLVDMYPPYC